jgi:drug/metabolite transporter (DMT)-like permease
MTITAYQLTFGGFILILMGLLMHGEMGAFNGRSALLFSYMVFLSTVAFSIWTLLLKYNPVGKVAIFGCSIPIFGVLLSAIFLNEQVFTIQNLTALICVSVGIMVVNHTGKQEI